MEDRWRKVVKWKGESDKGVQRYESHDRLFGKFWESQKERRNRSSGNQEIRSGSVGKVWRTEGLTRSRYEDADLELEGRPSRKEPVLSSRLSRTCASVRWFSKVVLWRCVADLRSKKDVGWGKVCLWREVRRWRINTLRIHCHLFLFVRLSM
jgi:hypothetical protein